MNRYTHENDACKKSDISNPILKSNLALLKLMCRYKLPLNAVKEFKEWAHNSVKLKADIFHLKPTIRETMLKQFRAEMGIVENEYQFKEHIIN